MQFIFPSLAWAFLLAAVPLLIHLINMMRHQRVQWAPMVFLLASFKKHRRWIWLKQLLLLLMRMAAVAAVVAMAAQLITPDQWANLFGGKVTHHYVLLDDSYSMSDRAGGETVMDRAKRVVDRIADRAAARQTRQIMTLVRFSQAARPTDTPEADLETGLLADLNAMPVEGDFRDALSAKQSVIRATQLAVGPGPALGLLRLLFDNDSDENRIVYVISDFRSGQWANPAELKQTLNELQKAGADVHLVSCAEYQRPNLGITYLMPTEATRVAGVPLFVRVKVKNFGTVAAKNVQLKIRPLYYPTSEQDFAEPARLDIKADQLPTELIEEIAPGETVARRVQVIFSAEGQHVVEAILPDDPVAADNRRYCVVSCPATERVLVIDDDSRKNNGAYFLRSMFQPGGRVSTGITPDVKRSSYLRDVSLDELRDYRAVYLLGVSRLDPSAVKTLEAYVKEGGGLSFFLGPDSNVIHYNDRLYREGEGLFPIPLDRIDVLEPQLDDAVPDFEVIDHPVMSVFSGVGSLLLPTVDIEQYFRAREDWTSLKASVKTLATLHNGMPLVVERQFGEGRVIAFLTTLAPDWNNWARGGPSFPVVLLQLQAYLAAPQRIDLPRQVGQPIDLVLSAEKFRPEVKFITPSEKPTGRKPISLVAHKRTDEGRVQLTASLGRSRAAAEDGAARSGQTDAVGIYETWAMSAEGKPNVRRYAMNVEPEEGDLALVGHRQLLDALKPARPEIHRFEDIEYALAEQAGFNWSRLIMYGLICLLLGEQLLAYAASYHPARGGAR